MRQVHQIAKTSVFSISSEVGTIILIIFCYRNPIFIDQKEVQETLVTKQFC